MHIRGAHILIRYPDLLCRLFISFYRKYKFDESYPAPSSGNYGESVVALSPLQACSYKMFYESSILSYASLRTRENKEIVKAVLTMFIQGATEIYKLQNNWYLSSQSRKYEIYQEFLKLVMKHYTIHHGTSFYADELGLSLPHFCSTIKKAAGNTPLEVIASVILMEAKSRLKSTDEPVKNIALSLGFNNISFFNKFFKQHTGITLKNIEDANLLFFYQMVM